jgi:hypothetical protein
MLYFNNSSTSIFFSTEEKDCLTHCIFNLPFLSILYLLVTLSSSVHVSSNGIFNAQSLLYFYTLNSSSLCILLFNQTGSHVIRRVFRKGQTFLQYFILQSLTQIPKTCSSFKKNLMQFLKMANEVVGQRRFFSI